MPQIDEWVGRFDRLFEEGRTGDPDAARSAEAAEHLRDSLHHARERGRPAEERAWAVFDRYIDLDRGGIIPAPDGGDRVSADAAVREEALSLWAALCDQLAPLEAAAASLRGKLRRASGPVARVGREYVAEADAACERTRDLIRYLVIAAPELGLTIPEHLAESVLAVRVSPWAYLRAMWNLFWSAVRHPLSVPTLDLRTGRVLYRT